MEDATESWRTDVQVFITSKINTLVLRSASAQFVIGCAGAGLLALFRYTSVRSLISSAATDDGHLLGALAHRIDHMTSQLILTVIKAPLEDWIGQTKQFGPGGGSLGRTPDSTWVLADPQRIISRVHARISFDNGRFRLTDQSMNGVYLNGAQSPLGAGMTVPLQDGDVFRLGHYQFKVSVAAATLIRPAALPPDIEPLEFFDDLPAAAPATAPSAWNPAPLSVSQSEDPLHLLDVKSLVTEPEGGYAWDPLAARGDTGSALQQAVSIAPIIPDDWNQEGDVNIGSQAETQLATAPQCDAGESRSKVSTHPPALSQHNELSANLSAFISDFLNQEGSVFTPEQIEQIVLQWGDVLRASVSGIMQALLARGAMKNELRITSTLVKPAENNPLKFSISVEDALDKLFTRRARGFMPAVEAVEDALQDIAEHQLALMSASRAVSQRLVQQISPEALELKLDKRGRSRLRNKKAQLWDEYCAQLDEWNAENGAALNALFNQEYAKAYEEALQSAKQPVKRHPD